MGHTDYNQLTHLVKLAQKGDRKAFNELYRMTSKTQYYYITQILPDMHEAQDVLQETYLLLYQNLDKITPPKAFYSYLTRLSYFVSKNHVKMRNRRLFRTADMEEAAELVDSKIGLEEKIEKEEKERCIREAVEKLTGDQRSVITMRYYDGMTMSAIAYTMDLSLSTVNRLYRSARVQLKESMRKQGIVPVIIVPSVLKKVIGDYINAIEFPQLPDHVGVDAAEKSEYRIQADGISLYNGSHGVKLLFMISAASVFAAAGGMLLPAPGFRTVVVPEEYRKSPALIEIYTEGAQKVDRVVMTDSKGENIEVKRLGEGGYTAKISQNGIHKITVRGRNGKTAVREVEVTCIDDTPPEAFVYKTGEDEIQIRFTDKESGIDEKSLYCESSSGTLTRPVSFDPETNISVFKPGKENQILHYSDRAGNSIKAPLDFIP